VKIRENYFFFNKVKGLLHNPYFLFLIVTIAFFIAILSLVPIQISEVGSSEAFVLEVIPIIYWAAICVMVCTILLAVPFIGEKKVDLLFILSAIMLLICFRMVFPIIFTSVPSYEPDTTNYMNTVNNWVHSGIDFGVQGQYEHNYPLSFIIAYVFVKLGASIDTFYRIAPFVIYVLNMLFLYLLLREVTGEDKRGRIISSFSLFLFSFSSVAYWVTLHWCPDLFGSLMFMVSFYLTIRFAKSNEQTFKQVLPVLLCIFLLILSHHLSTLYFIVTLAGFALSCWYFKPKLFKNGQLIFFLLAIFTYTIWFIYGTLVYPSFFNVYVYFSGFTSTGQQVATAGWFNTISFAIYPVFILIFSFIAIFNILNIKQPLTVIKKIFPKNIATFSNIRQKMNYVKINYYSNPFLMFMVGFIAVLLLFVVGLGVPVLFGSRIIEVLFIGLYPLASQPLLDKLTNAQSSRKVKVAIFVLLLFVVLSGIYRYYSSIQRRILLG
jgi:hypothetical protein